MTYVCSILELMYLTYYSDADYAEDLVNCKSTSGIVQTLEQVWFHGARRSKIPLPCPLQRQSMWQLHAVPMSYELRNMYEISVLSLSVFLSIVIILVQSVSPRILNTILRSSTYTLGIIFISTMLKKLLLKFSFVQQKIKLLTFWQNQILEKSLRKFAYN